MLDPREEDLEKLAETCLAAAKQIKQYLASNNHPQMTFDQNGPSTFPPATPEIQHLRLDLRAAARKLYDLSSDPEDILTWHLYQSVHDLNALRYVHKYGIALAIPHNASISYSDLALQLKLDPSQMKQMLRQLMAINVFTESQPGLVTHTCASRLLVTSPGIAAYSCFIAEDTFPIAAKQIDTLEAWGHGQQEPNRAAPNHHYNTELPFFEYVATKNPAAAERFSKIMTHVVANNPLMSHVHVARGFDWSQLARDSVVVDLAGSMGHCSIPIAESTDPSVRLVVQDLPQIIARASAPETSVIPSALRSRFEFMAHDFYQPQPIRAAAVYFIRMIMHDYSDAYALKILRAVVPAMAPDSRILIMDQVMPPGVGMVPAPIERVMRTQDLQMMLLTNAKERDAGEWADLVSRAGEGLVDDIFRHAAPGGAAESNGQDAGGKKNKKKKLAIVNIQTPPGSMMSVIEVGFVDDDDDGDDNQDDARV